MGAKAQGLPAIDRPQGLRGNREEEARLSPRGRLKNV